MENNNRHRIKVVVVNCCRFILATAFIFSGFVKAVDPMGTQYKIEDYLSAFHLIDWVPSFFPIVISVLLSCVEFTIGGLLLLGIRRKVATYGAFLLMLLMTPLTLYLALFDPISDCGCFGDAVTLSNWDTFWKNILLLISSFFTFKYRRVMFRFYTLKTEWMASLYTICYVFGLSLYCLYYLPVIDFRPYHIGVNFRDGRVIPEGAKPSIYETIFVLEKDGVQEEFTVENYPDSTWTFVESKTKLIQKGYEPPLADFSMVDIETGLDITDDILSDSIFTFLLVSYRLDLADDSNIDLVNEIYDYSIEQGYNFYALTSSYDDEIEVWCDKTGAEYPFAHGDDIVLKTMIRSNPGLVLIKNGVIYNKWSHNDLPDEFDLSTSLEKLPLGEIAIEKNNQLSSVTMGYWVPLLLFFLFDITMIRKGPKSKKDGDSEKQEDEELNEQLVDNEGGTLNEV
ncbi:MAG: DoxX family protein [Bacteroides sp.]|nr:DoxX family protein [Bacteroides sp.]